MALIDLTPDTPAYPLSLDAYLAGEAPNRLMALGNQVLLRQRSLALFCSVRCPGSLILKSHDLAQQLRQANVPVISSFHSPIEKECLTILLRGRNPLILCPARSLVGLQLRAEWRAPLEQGRLLLLSPFAPGQRRPNTAMARQRNRLVGALAGAIFIAYAAPGGKTEQLCRDFITWGKPVYTFQSETTAHLIELGIKPVEMEELVEGWAKVQATDGRG